MVFISVEYPSLNSVWTKFQNMFSTIGDALLYIPAYRSYHWQMLEELYNDNVMYAEVRLSFHEVSADVLVVFDI